MADLNTLKQKLTLNKQRWSSMHKDNAAILEKSDKETRPEEKIRLKSVISSQQTDMAEIEAMIQKLELQIKELSKSNKVQILKDELADLRRKQSFQVALDVARQIQTQFPDDPQIISEIKELEQRLKDSKKAQLTLAKLTPHFAALSPVIADIAKALSPSSDNEHRETIITIAEQFICKDLSASDFIAFCQQLLSPANTQNTTLNNNTQQYLKVANSINSGRTVLFIGSGISSLYSGNPNKSSENHLASRLADEIGYPEFNGSLSAISEYYQLVPGFGRNNLLSSLHNSLSTEQMSLKFYDSLARIKSPLVIVSTAYNTLLERALRTLGKPYVEIASIIVPGEGKYKIGNVMLRYFDPNKKGKQIEKVCSQENLSDLDLIKNYTIIYKLRGSCGQSHLNGDIGWRNSLTLSESNYFTFAESASKLIPDYISRQFLDREFLILGFTPEKWEDRLIARALLAKRKNSPELCYTIGKSIDPLQNVFWENQKVRQNEMEFSELDRHLQEATQ